MQYLVAEASSGDMGGSLSHEYHLPNSAGEDEIVSCDNCSYQANMEIASDEATTVGIVRSRSAAPDTGGTSGDRVLEPVVAQEAGPGPPSHILMWSGVADNGPTLVNVFYPRCSSQAGREKGINVAAIKSIVPSLDAGREDAAHWWEAQYLRHSENEPSIYKPRIINIYDGRLSTAVDSSGVSAAAESLISEQIPSERLAHVHTTQMTTDPASGRLLNVLSVVGGDPCPRCREGRLRIQQAIELGHTFFLGTRYTEIFRAHAHVDGAADPKESTTRLPLQMGCYGIGVSRVIGAVAGAIADETGLNWPRVMAPFEVVVIYRDPMEEDAKAVYDALRDGVPTDDSARSNDGLSSHSATLDIVLDDRRQGFIWKLKDADLLGFPVVVVLGRAWASERKLEVHCRRLGGLREEVPLRELPAFVHGLLDQL
ncbi:MAG: hypothetical protein M1815_001419 [Lichina confinis]|nr:MAG: hypothetical protein M1815_001419 [Lichina confinis]